MSDKRIFQGTVINKGTLSRYEKQEGGGKMVNTHYPHGSLILLNQAELDYYVTELGHVEIPMVPAPIATLKNPGGKFAAEPNQDNHESTQENKGSADPEVHKGPASDQGNADTEVGESSKGDEEVTPSQPHWTKAYNFTPGVTKALIDTGMTQDETADSTMVELLAIRGIGAKAGNEILEALNPVELVTATTTEAPTTPQDDLLS